MRKALLLLCVLWAWQARADYSPFVQGRVWVFRGAGQDSIGPYEAKQDATPVLTYQMRVQLRVAQAGAGTGSMTTIYERDSLYARKTGMRSRANGATTLLAGLADTVKTRNLFYSTWDTSISLQVIAPLPNEPIDFIHRLRGDPFFSFHRASPSFSILSNLPRPYTGVWPPTARYIWIKGKDSVQTSVAGWYVDGIGPTYLAWDFGAPSMCGRNPFGLTLWLDSLDGAPVNPALAPAGRPLAKESRIACAIRRAIGGPGFFPRGSGLGVDALGRSERRERGRSR